MAELKYANPIKYAVAVEKSLNAFEQALATRYQEKLKEHDFVWAPHGSWEPQLEQDRFERNYPEFIRAFDEAEEKAPGWATEFRNEVAAAIPLYETQDLDKLTMACDRLHDIAILLGSAEKDSPPVTSSGLSLHVREITTATWWSGIAGETFEKYFGRSTFDTTENHQRIANLLMNRYAERAAIIESVRRNVLTSIGIATEKLGGKSEVDNSETELWEWTGASVVALAIGIANAPAGVVASTAVIIGNAFDFFDVDMEYTDDVASIVAEVKANLKKAKDGATNTAYDWSMNVQNDQTSIANVDLEALELYDFTKNDGTGQPGNGFDIEDIGMIQTLAMHCFGASDIYGQALKDAIAVDAADDHLRGRDGAETAGDSELKESHDIYVSFLKTTCARYQEAGELVAEAARRYYAVETDTQQMLNEIAQSADLGGGTVEQHIGPTDRSPITLENWGKPVP